MSGTHLTQEEDEKVLRLYAAGFSEREISEMTGRSRNSIARSLKRQEVEKAKAETRQKELMKRIQPTPRVRLIPSVFHLGANHGQLP